MHMDQGDTGDTFVRRALEILEKARTLPNQRQRRAARELAAKLLKMADDTVNASTPLHHNPGATRGSPQPQHPE